MEIIKFGEKCVLLRINYQKKLNVFGVSETEDEVVMGDKLISFLGIVIEEAEEGFWRFKMIN